METHPFSYFSRARIEKAWLREARVQRTRAFSFIAVPWGLEDCPLLMRSSVAVKSHFQPSSRGT